MPAAPPAATGSRDLAIDALRGIAITMVPIALTAPTDGPLHIFTLTEFLTVPLIVLVIGLGAGLHRVTRWRGTLLRAAVLLVIGALLMLVHAQVVNLLWWVAGMTVIASLLSRLPHLAVAALGLASLLISPWLKVAAIDWVAGLYLPHYTSWWWRPFDLAVDFLVAGDYFRMSTLLVYVCAGILLSRRAVSSRANIVVAVIGLAAGAGTYVADQLGVITLTPYIGTLPVVTFNLAMVVGIAGVVRIVAHRSDSVLRPFAAIGAMALSAYVGQVLFTAAYLATDPPGGRDDSWVVMISLLILTAALSLGWSWLARGSAMARGPLEGLVNRFTRPSAGATNPAFEADVEDGGRAPVA